jgi:hypothetical protein
MLAVFERVGLDLTEQILANALGEAALDLASFASQPSAGGKGVPDAEIKARFRYLIETKITPNQYGGTKPDAQLGRHLSRFDGSYGDEKLLAITPDAEEPPGIAAMNDQRVAWIGFPLLAQGVEEVLTDPAEPASEQQRFLLRELVAFFDAEGLLGFEDTVIVAGRFAYPEYLEISAYICQSNRSIRPVTRLGFYTEKEIKPELPRVESYYRDVVMTEESAAQFEVGSDPLGRRVAEIIRSRLIDGTPQDPTNDIYVLSNPGSDDTVLLDNPVRHEERGAWVQGQRYAVLDQLRQAATTRELG